MSSSSRIPSASGGASMKQKKLTFTTAKRTASASGAKGGNVIKSKKTFDSPSGDHSTEAEDDVKIQVEQTEVQRRTSSSPPSITQKGQLQRDLPGDKDISSTSRSALNPKDVRWRQLIADAKAKRNGQPLVHGKNENEIHQVLRAFDLNYDYGPCVGVTRLERWERAHALGLNPPAEIRDILSTREGSEEKTYVECVFHEEV